VAYLFVELIVHEEALLAVRKYVSKAKNQSTQNYRTDPWSCPLSSVVILHRKYYYECYDPWGSKDEMHMKTFYTILVIK